MLTNQINEMKRAMLLDYYQYQVAPSNNLTLTTHNNIYQHLLIDIQTAAQTKTTRVVEALNNIQLYINLVLMNMVEGHSGKLDPKELKEWEESLSNYSSWKTCRQMQSYPENYLNPTSRTNKSEAFKRLENSLMQGDLDNDTIQMLVDQYLKSFNESSEIQFVNGCFDIIDSQDRKYYFIGRTRSRPYKYYWRMLEFDSGNAIWSEWKEMMVPLGAAAYNTTRLAYFNSRLCVTWIDVQDKKEVEDGKITDKEMKSMKGMNLSIAYKEKDDSWSMLKTLLSMDQTKGAWDLPANGEQNNKTDLLTSATFVVKKLGKDYLFVGVVSDNTTGDSDHSSMEVIIDNNNAVYRNVQYYQDVIEFYTWAIKSYNLIGLPTLTTQLTKELNSLKQKLQFVKSIIGDQPTLRYNRFRYPKTLQYPVEFKASLKDVKSTSLTTTTYTNPILNEYLSIEKGNVTVEGSEATVNAKLTLKADTINRIDIKETVGSETYTRTLLIYNRDDQPNVYIPVDINPLPSGTANKQGTLYDEKFDKISNINYLNITSITPGAEFEISAGDSLKVQVKIHHSYRASFSHQLKDSSGQILQAQRHERLDGAAEITHKFDIINSYNAVISPFTFTHELLITHYSGAIEVIVLTYSKKVEIFFEEKDSSDKRIDIIINTDKDKENEIEYLDFGQEMLGKKIILNTVIVKKLIKVLEKGGLEELLSYETQSTMELTLPGEMEESKIDFYGVNGLYLWELFFYLPWLVAHQMKMQQRYKESQDWLHYIFDPRDEAQEGGKFKYWKTRPLIEEKAGNIIGRGICDPYVTAMKKPIHFRKAIFLSYADNVIEQGKSIYEKNDLNKALLYFVQANSLLGNKPEINTISKWTPITLKELEAQDHLPYIMINLPSKTTKVRSTLPLSATSDSTLFRLPSNIELLRHWERIQMYLDKIHLGIRVDGSIDSDLGGGGRSSGSTSNSNGVSATSKEIVVYTFVDMYQYAQEAVDNLIGYGEKLISVLEKKDTAHVEELQANYIEQLYEHSIQSKEKKVEEAEAMKKALEHQKTAADVRIAKYTILTGSAIGNDLVNVIKNVRKLKNASTVAKTLTETTQVSLEASSKATTAIPSFFGFTVGAESNVTTSITASLSKVTEIAANYIEVAIEIAAEFIKDFNQKVEYTTSLATAVNEKLMIEEQIKAQDAMIEVAKEDGKFTKKEYERDMKVMKYLTKDRFSKASLYQWMRNKILYLYKDLFMTAHNMCRSAEESYRYHHSYYPVKTANFIEYYPGNKMQKPFIGDMSDVSLDNDTSLLLAGEMLKLSLLKMYEFFTILHRRKLEIIHEILFSKESEVLFKKKEKKEWKDVLADLKQTGKIEFQTSEKIFAERFPSLFNRHILYIELNVFLDEAFNKCINPQRKGSDKDYMEASSEENYSNKIRAHNIAATLTQKSNKILAASGYDMLGNASPPDIRAVEILINETCEYHEHIKKDLNVDYPQKVIYSLSAAVGNSLGGGGSLGLFTLETFNKFGNNRYLPFENTGVHATWELEFPNHTSAMQQSYICHIEDIQINIYYQAREGGEEFGKKVLKIVNGAPSTIVPCEPESIST